ncbi:hypothetical protein J8273_6694 [Carpediemonas membranifera]|uniref:Swt1-like HEPN domain-containing protein n=1 Tax=Carpediemonas membranifera TaxID=201153 RepID=A0A8J6AUK6_9EUKA|nr:hypothetical protein J8273_6694 [Carpediemonas membranifera]|eukprot:KAG9391965.1 hypothetical protein J8273_6694 [Carpediemonas membranifera]
MMVPWMRRILASPDFNPGCKPTSTEKDLLGKELEQDVDSSRMLREMSKRAVYQKTHAKIISDLIKYRNRAAHNELEPDTLPKVLELIESLAQAFSVPLHNNVRAFIALLKSPVSLVATSEHHALTTKVNSLEDEIERLRSGGRKTMRRLPGVRSQPEPTTLEQATMTTTDFGDQNAVDKEMMTDQDEPRARPEDTGKTRGTLMSRTLTASQVDQLAMARTHDPPLVLPGRCIVCGGSRETSEWACRRKSGTTPKDPCRALIQKNLRILCEPQIRVQYLTIEAVSFSSTADLVSKLRTLADLYANFDTYWVISGHTETSTSRLVIDAATNDALFLHNFVELITAAFKEPTVVDQTRVRMIYFATCTRDNDTAETTELMKTISTKPYRHTCIILTPEQVLANELHLQDCFWIYRTLCMDNPFDPLPNAPQHPKQDTHPAADIVSVNVWTKQVEDIKRKVVLNTEKGRCLVIGDVILSSTKLKIRPRNF